MKQYCRCKVKMVPGEWGALQSEAPLSIAEVEAKAQGLLSEMTLEEKIDHMSGDTPLICGMLEMVRSYNRRPLPAGENLRLGIPGIRFSDGPRGVVMYHSTCFPVTMARGATWDTRLEERIGDAIGVEARSQGANFFGGVCINLLRHPAWGRAQETYGEDSFHLGEMGAALVRGVQRHIMACVKHFAANSLENARFKVDVQINERTLREVYLPHFKRCIDEGAASIMSAYNKVNQIYCGHHHHLLRGILKEDWGFKGFVISDFVLGVRDAAAAVNGGLDIEMPFTWRFGKKLTRMVRNEIVSQEVIDEAVLRILRQKIRFAQIGEHERYGQHAVASQAHRALAREAAQKSMVLLKNDGLQTTQKPLLPLERSEVKQIAVIGKLARMKNTGDRGSSMVRPPYIVTPLEGLQKAANRDIGIAFNDGERIDQAVTVARRADIVIIVVGYTYNEEGEYIPFPSKGGDRDSLRLRAHDEAVIKAIAAENPSTVVVLIGGSAIVTEPWRETIPAILMAWYPGMEGGHALTDILFGKVNPSGKLPCVFPKSEAQLPYFDKNAESIEYGYYHGYRLMDKDGESAAFPFGFGLSYTTFEYQNLCLERKEIGVDGTLQVKVDISNTGYRVGEEIAQLYVGYIDSKVERPVKTLKGFCRVKLEPQETKTITFALPARQLAYYDEHKADWEVERISYNVYVGPSSSEDRLLSTQFHITLIESELN